jgi:hypothetical protein
MAFNESVAAIAATGRLTSIQTVEDALAYLPDNPLRDPFARAWIHMTTTYTEFQIASIGSMIYHEA